MNKEDKLRAALEQAWLNAAGRKTGSYQDDLEALGAYFNPAITRADLLKKLARLKPISFQFPPDEPPLVMETRWGPLITPEGRLALGVMSGERESTQETALLEIYRDWSRGRIEAIVFDEVGKLLPLAVGMMLLLVASCARDMETAIVVPSAPEIEQLRTAFVPPLQYLDGAIRETGKTGEIEFDGWPISHVRTSLKPDVQRVPAKGHPFRVWLEPEGAPRAVELIARQLLDERGMTAEDAIATVDKTLSLFGTETVPVLYQGAQRDLCQQTSREVGESIQRRLERGP
jgi:hypothetical protein